MRSFLNVVAFFSSALFAVAAGTRCGGILFDCASPVLLLVAAGAAGGGTSSSSVPAADAASEGRIQNEIVHLPGHTVESRVTSALPHSYIARGDLPENFRWDRVVADDGGTNATTPATLSYITKALNQHVPQ